MTERLDCFEADLVRITSKIAWPWTFTTERRTPANFSSSKIDSVYATDSRPISRSEIIWNAFIPDSRAKDLRHFLSASAIGEYMLP